MKLILSLLILFVIFTGCDLSTEQETQLNKDLSNLIIVRNNGDALSYLNYTHPIVVKYYKSLGDSIYKKRFQSVSPKSSREYLDTSAVYWTNAYQKEIKSDDSLIQVKVQITLAKGYDEIDSSNTIYAVSKKNGSNWLFIESQDYFSDYFPEDLRLFQK
ncbi:MAG: hypothetical protein COA32_09375 [Fluviicola sp.]|nr:MAG: hypothetical protein COA32_09375 [Fluviicola sp.]